MTDDCFSLCFTFQVSTSILLGWSKSILLHRSKVSIAAISLRKESGCTLVKISQAAEGVERIPPLMNRKALFCILSRFCTNDLLHVVSNHHHHQLACSLGHCNLHPVSLLRNLVPMQAAL